MGSGQPAIEIKELTKKYGHFVALDRLTLSVERGQILGFVGPNGAGKTTTIKILVGLARPTSGTATIAGVSCVAGARRIKRLVGYMPDVLDRKSTRLNSSHTVISYAVFCLKKKTRKMKK